MPRLTLHLTDPACTFATPELYSRLHDTAARSGLPASMHVRKSSRQGRFNSSMSVASFAEGLLSFAWLPRRENTALSSAAVAVAATYVLCWPLFSLFTSLMSSFSQQFSIFKSDQQD